MNVAIVGSRTYPELWRVVEYIRSLPADTVIVSGGARGVDSVAESAARKFGLSLRVFLADWNQFGKSAGYRRNVDIVNMADKVVAFWDGKSKGTQHSMNLAKTMHKELEVILPTGATQ